MTSAIGIAIPTYERAKITPCSFAAVHNDPRVMSVAVVDDASTAASYNNLQDALKVFPKVVVSKNVENLGCYLNKRESVRRSLAKWVAVFDSDNVMTTEYLDALFAQQWHDDVLYMPVWAQPSLDYRQYEGLVLTRENVAEYLELPLFMAALNTGNFFVCKSSYMRVFDDSVKPFAADSMYFAYCWLAFGGRLLLTPGLHYAHLVHAGYWMQHAHQSTVFADVLAHKMRRQEWSMSSV